MKQLTCEMCGGTDLIKQDGVFVCQSCGCKYSVEEAKKMMVEGTVQVVGTVKIDNSDSYDKYINLAKDAFEDSRYESAYDYSSKALDINTENLEMLLLQGLSLLGKDEVGKSVPVGCVNAVEKYLKEMSSFEWTAETAQEFTAAMQRVESVCNYKTTALRARLAEIEVDLWPTRGAMDILADLGRPAFVASQNQAEDKRIELHNQQVRMKCYPIQEKINLVSAFRRETIAQMEALAKPKIEVIAKAKFDEYWTVHADEKELLEKEKTSLEERIESLNATATASAEERINAIKAHTDTLQAEYKKVGIFQMKRMKELESELEVAKQELKEAECVHEKAKEKLGKDVESLKARIAEIDAELTKDRM